MAQESRSAVLECPAVGMHPRDSDPVLLRRIQYLGIRLILRNHGWLENKGVASAWASELNGVKFRTNLVGKQTRLRPKASLASYNKLVPVS